MKEVYCTVYTKEHSNGLGLTKAEWETFDRTKLNKGHGLAIEFYNGERFYYYERRIR